MSAPPIVERHKPHFHRKAPLLESVRAATTANITIATALNNGDTLDGVTLATDDRVLVKDQSTGSQNGIYVVGASPVRDYDVSTDDPAFGYLVLVREGTANVGKVYRNTNTSAPTIGSTSITYSEFAPSTTPTITVQDEGTPLTAGATTLNFVGAGVTASGTGVTKTITVPGGAATLDDLTDVSITSPATADRLRYNGSAWVNSALIWTPTTVFNGTDWMILVDGDGNAIMAEA